MLSSGLLTLILNITNSLYTELLTSNLRTSIVSIILSSCLTIWVICFSSPIVVIVIREYFLSSVTPTEILSMLKLRDLKRCVTLNKIPGLFSTLIDKIAQTILHHYEGKIISFNPVPGATNGKTSSSGSIGMSITVATSLFNPSLIAFSSSSIDCARIPCAPYDSANLT